jgi:hypothetical protein
MIYLLLLFALLLPAPPRPTGTALHRSIDRVTAIRVARGELPRSVWNTALRVSSPYGRLGDRWKICSVQNGRCFQAIQVDVSRREHVAYQLRTGAGLEVGPVWYRALGCHVRERPRACKVTMWRVGR